MLLVVSTVRAGSRLLITKLAPTTSAWAAASATGHSAAAAAIRQERASRTPTWATRDALILSLLRHLVAVGHRPEAGRIVARRAAGWPRRARRAGLSGGIP